LGGRESPGGGGARNIGIGKFPAANWSKAGGVQIRSPNGKLREDEATRFSRGSPTAKEFVGSELNGGKGEDRSLGRQGLISATTNNSELGEEPKTPEKKKKGEKRRENRAVEKKK